MGGRFRQESTIAHQKIGAVDSATYMRVNSEATENLAKAAGECNPDVCFVFFPSVSVYGEGGQGTGDGKDILTQRRKKERIIMGLVRISTRQCVVNKTLMC